jgi:hypothetical protein
MVFPEPNRMFDPAIGIRTRAEPETVTGILVFTMLDLYSGVYQVLDTSVYHGYINDTIILLTVTNVRNNNAPIIPNSLFITV